MEKIRIEDDGIAIEGELIDTVKLNRIARKSCNGLTYLMNVMDDKTTKVYMWFKDESGKNYLVKL